ncbi:MAG: RES domain-containing protein [Deltaproteobacteria bacterium]|nr:MAG: RES domain-containing protein [Deltaproteobacteria bacterium]
MQVWRICSRRHQRFDGEGARLYGGRWNYAGTAVVYACASLALAALELFVHIDVDLLPNETVKAASLPRNWRRYPALESLKDIGTNWAARGSTAILAVPSAIIPEEQNYLLNPAHRDFKQVRLRRSIPFHFDPRMWK